MRKLLTTLLFILAWPTAVNAQGVCSNPILLKFFETLGAACKTGACDPSVMEELDHAVKKKDLLGALRNPSLSAVHIFFPSARYRLDEAFDWSTIKLDQLAAIEATLNGPHESAIVYVIGKASRVGDPDLNIRLSRERARGVVDYMRTNISDRFNHYHTAWAGEEVLQFEDSDATFLNLQPRDFRDDDLILNQAVHVFIYPCVEELKSSDHQ
ncbi:MAG: hypothetical protein AB7R40_26400 [Nitrospiraceae bacterium]